MSSSSSSNSSVSYIQIYKRWVGADYRRNGESTIPVDIILLKLRFRGVVFKSEYQMVDHKTTDEEKVTKLFLDIMPAKGEQGFNQLMEILLEKKYNDLANDLAGEIEKWLTDGAIQNPKIQVQIHLSRLIKEYVDSMAKYWSNVIPVAQLEAAFVNLQVLDRDKSTINPVCYREVFGKGETRIQRILIEAFPGCGKTTYVNKLALDWANGDEYLREKFDFVFLIPLQTLTMRIDDAIKMLLPKQSQTLFSSYVESAESKILLILDGLDELEYSKQYSFVMESLISKSKQFQFFHVIVTTGPESPFIIELYDTFPERFWIKGFDEQSMQQFLDKQHVPLPLVDQESNLSRLLRTPLFCAIYCSLHFSGGDRIDLEDSYDFIKVLVENSVTNTVKKKAVANVEEQLDEIGKFAFEMLDTWTLGFLGIFFGSSEVIKPSFDLSTVNLDLLIKRRIPTCGVDSFKEVFTFPHQLIVEYLAARYFARSFTKEQLICREPSSYIALHIPFARFFFTELLFLYLEKKYKEKVFENLLHIPELQFFWNVKSNKNITTLVNVNDINNFVHKVIDYQGFFPTLSKCRNLSSLRLFGFYLSKSRVEQFADIIDNNRFQHLTELICSGACVGSTPQLFTALSKCKYLQTLEIYSNLSVESTNELARCIDNNGLANLKELRLCHENVGSSSELFRVLHKCRQLQVLCLQRCSIKQQSLNIFLSTFNSNTFQQLVRLDLLYNEEIKVSDNFFIAVEKCPKISTLGLSKSMESDLSEVGRKAKEILEQRCCRFVNI